MNHNLALWLTFMSALIIGIGFTAAYFHQRLAHLHVTHMDHLKEVQNLAYMDGMSAMSRWIAEDTIASIEENLDLRK